MLLSVAFAGLTLAVSSAVSSGNSVMVFLLSSTPSTGVGASTVTAHSALALPQTAVMVAVPVFNAVTAPSFTVAILASEVVHSRESVVFSGKTDAVSFAVSFGFSVKTFLSSITSVAATALRVISR